jgi:hypothetical protein
MTQIVDNERAKLLANVLDRASTAVFTVGILTPAVSYFFNLQNVRDALGPGGLAAFVALSSLATAAPHLMARSVLGDLQ